MLYVKMTFLSAVVGAGACAQPVSMQIIPLFRPMLPVTGRSWFRQLLGAHNIISVIRLENASSFITI